MAHPRRGYVRQYETSKSRSCPPPARLQPYGQTYKGYKVAICTEITEVQSARTKAQQKKIAFEPAAPIGGTSSIVMFRSLVGLLCLATRPAVFFLLSSIVDSHTLLLLPPISLFPWSGSPPLPLLLPLPPFPWAPLTVDARRCLLSCAPSSCHFTMNPSAASIPPRYHPPRLFCSKQWNTARSQL